MGILKSKKFQVIFTGMISIVLIYALKVEKELADMLAKTIAAAVGLFVSGHTVTDIVWILVSHLKEKGDADEKTDDGGGAGSS